MEYSFYFVDYFLFFHVENIKILDTFLVRNQIIQLVSILFSKPTF